MDRVEIDGKTYVAKASDEACHSADGLRTPCAFYRETYLDTGSLCADRSDIAPCCSRSRNDERYIIWVEEEAK